MMETKQRPNVGSDTPRGEIKKREEAKKEEAGEVVDFEVLLAIFCSDPSEATVSSLTPFIPLHWEKQVLLDISLHRMRTSPVKGDEKSMERKALDLLVSHKIISEAERVKWECPNKAVPSDIHYESQLLMDQIDKLIFYCPSIDHIPLIHFSAKGLSKEGMSYSPTNNIHQVSDLIQSIVGSKTKIGVLPAHLKPIRLLSAPEYVYRFIIKLLRHLQVIEDEQIVTWTLLRNTVSNDKQVVDECLRRLTPSQIILLRMRLLNASCMKAPYF